MASITKSKEPNEIHSMFLVPKKMYNSLINLLQDDEDTKNEIMGINQTGSNNYIENAITFKKQRDQQQNISNNSAAVNRGISTLPSNVTRGPPSVLTRDSNRPSSPNNFSVPSNVGGEVTPSSNATSNFGTPTSGAYFTAGTKKKRPSMFDTSTPVGIGKKRPEFDDTPIDSGGAAAAADAAATPSNNENVFKNSPITRALNVRIGGRLICPFQACQKKYTSIKVLGPHLLKEHIANLGINEQKVIKSSIKKSAKKEKKTRPTAEPDSDSSGGPDRGLPRRKNLFFPDKYPPLK